MPRQPSTMIVTGARGLGKTYKTLIMLKEYVVSNKNRRARPVLVFDANIESDYKDFKGVAIDKVHLIKRAGLYKVCPKITDGDEEKEEILHKLLDGRFKHGLLLLEDFNNYASGTRSKKIFSALTTNRHKGLDIVIQLQSIAAIDQKMWQNLNFIRMHHQTSLVEEIKGRKGVNFEILKLAELIVSDERKSNEYFFIYIDYYNSKLLNTTKKQFSKAAKTYLKLYPRVLSFSGLESAKCINEKAKEYLE